MPDMIQRKASNVLVGDTIVLREIEHEGLDEIFCNANLKVRKKILDHTWHTVRLELEGAGELCLHQDEVVESPDEGHTKSHHLGEFPLTCSECQHELRHEYEYETAPEPLEN